MCVCTCVVADFIYRVRERRPIAARGRSPPPPPPVEERLASTAATERIRSGRRVASSEYLAAAIGFRRQTVRIFGLPAVVIAPDTHCLHLILLLNRVRSCTARKGPNQKPLYFQKAEKHFRIPSEMNFRFYGFGVPVMSFFDGKLILVNTQRDRFSIFPR